MSTVCKILVASGDTEKIESILLTHMIEVHGEDILLEDTDWPSATDNKAFIADTVEATIFSLKEIVNDITEIYYNSFSYNDRLASVLSSELKTKVVVLMYQSTAEACYWSYFENGLKRKAIETGDGAIIKQEGDFLSFEAEPLGHPLGEADDTDFIFDGDDLDAYTKKIGIDVETYQDYGKGWRTIRYQGISYSDKRIEDRHQKPWWKLW